MWETVVCLTLKWSGIVIYAIRTGPLTLEIVQELQPIILL